MLAWTPATAQQLLDPTEPPAGALRPAAGANAAQPLVSQGPQLQSVLHGSRGRELAVIDGLTIRRGEKFDGAVLVNIGKDEVVLKRGKQLQVLRLYPGQPATVASEPSRR
ncbi:MSHA biogenesis protein MshK [Oxalobacteraceae bacterium]|nr:MSHA biogenesis protein MshK [Oxalobacteraceae bacterium]